MFDQKMRPFKTKTTKQIANITRVRGPISQTQLAQVTGFGQGTINNAVRNLLEEGWIQEKCRVSSGGRGRPHTLLSINPNAAFAIGIDVGGQNLRVGLVNLAGEVLDNMSERIQPDTGPEDILRRAIEMTYQVIARSPIEQERISGLGFGLSGIIDPKEGVCLFCPNLPGWINIPVGEIFSEEFGDSVIVDDSSRMMALAEKAYGHGRDIDDLIYIGLGVGIGGAIFIQGKLYRGHMGFAGELGHITVEDTGPLCHCGNLGCLEALACANAIVQRAREAIQSGVYSSILTEIDEMSQNNDVKAISLAAKKGDKLAFDILDKTGEYIGIGVAALINLLNPSTIVLGGGIAQAGDILLASIRRTVKQRALGMSSRAVSIRQSQLGRHAGVIGGAAAIFGSVLHGEIKLGERRISA